MSRETKRALLVLLGALATIAVFAVYSPWSARTFLRDDHVLLENENASYREASVGALFVSPSWPDVGATDTRIPYYRPLVLASFQLDLALGGTPVESHFTNVFAHALATLLLAACATRLGASGGAAILASLLFGLAPRLTESVAWVSGRTDVLAGAFVFASIALSPDVPTRPVHRAPGRDLALALASGACLFAALASKEVAIAGAAALVALALARREDDVRRGARSLRLAVGVGLPLLVWAGLRAIALAGPRADLRSLGLAERGKTVLEAVGRYAEMLALPLSPRTFIGVVGVPDNGRVAVGAVIVAVALGLSVRASMRWRRQRPAAGLVTPLVLFAVSLGPVLHVIPFGAGGNVACDRFLYLPLGALAIAGAVASARLERSKAAVVAGAVVLALAFAWTTRARAHDYDDETRFWLVAAEEADEASVAPFNALGTLVEDAGLVDLGCRVLGEGRNRARRSGQQHAPVARRNLEALARCHAFAGRYDEGVRVAEELVASFPGVGRGYLVLGFARLHAGDSAAAEAAFARAVDVDASLAPTVVPLTAAVRVAQTRAPAFADEGARRGPSWVEYLVGLGRMREAEAAAYDVVASGMEGPEARTHALRFLVLNGDVRLARRALDHVVAPPRLVETLVRRESARARVERLGLRLERLTPETSHSTPR